MIKDNSNFAICQCLNTVQIPLFGKTDSTCNLCKNKMAIYGPFWNKAIHDKSLLENMIQSIDEKGNERMLGILRLMKQEIPDMFYYEMPKLSSHLKVNCCKLKDVLTGLANKNYLVSLTHCDNNAFKTNASIEVVSKLIHEIQAGVFTEFSLETNTEINELFEQDFYKGKIISGLKPLALPKK